MWLGACQSNEGEKESSPDAAPTIQTLRLTDQHNYSTQSSLSIPIVETAAGTDIELCWDEVTTDLQCHEVDPSGDIDNVALLRFRGLSYAALEEKLVSTRLSMSDVLGYLEHNIEDDSTCTRLLDLDFFGTDVDVLEQYVEDEDISYMALFATGTEPGVGARTMLFLRPTADSTVDRVQAPPGCGGDLVLDFEAQLSETRLPVPLRGPWLLDWHDVELDGGGQPIEDVPIDGVLVGFYAGMTVSELENDILDLELIYTNLWEQPLDRGKSADLSGLVERDTGEAFDGFERDESGVWVLGLTCSTCQNPAPVVFTVLDPGGEAQ
jgi:hypothetical protein